MALLLNDCVLDLGFRVRVTHSNPGSLSVQKVDPQTAEAINAFLLKLIACANGEQAFTFVLDDPSGNSFIENP
jgi:C4-type Zn-finger protein